MTYHFDEIIDRRNTNSLKWDVEEKELPMWVADMDFRVPQCVIAGLRSVPHMEYSGIRSFRRNGSRRMWTGGNGDTILRWKRTG